MIFNKKLFNKLFKMPWKTFQEEITINAKYFSDNCTKLITVMIYMEVQKENVVKIQLISTLQT